MPQACQVLIVANRTAAGPELLDAIRERALEAAASFHLVVPASPHGLHRVVDPEVAGRAEAQQRLETALPELSAAAGGVVTGHVGDSDPLAAIHDAVFVRGFDEIIVSTLPRRLSRWLHIDLPSKARALGLPLRHVEAREAPLVRRERIAPHSESPERLHDADRFPDGAVCVV